MKLVYKKALENLKKRSSSCLSAASKGNNMADCGWSDLRSLSYWMQEHYKAVYMIEKINQRIKSQKAA